MPTKKPTTRKKSPPKKKGPMNFKTGKYASSDPDPEQTPAQTPARARARKKIEEGKTPDSIPTPEEGEKPPADDKRITIEPTATTHVYRLKCDYCEGVGQGTKAEMETLRDTHVKLHIKPAQESR